MAKGRSSRGSAHGTPSSLTSLLSPTIKPTKPMVAPTTLSYLQQDIQQEAALATLKRSQWHPQQQRRPANATKRSSTRLVIGGVAIPTQELRIGPISTGVRFAVPHKIGICVRRKIRREVLHALLRTNKSGGGKSPRRRNFYSGIKC